MLKFRQWSQAAIAQRLGLYVLFIVYGLIRFRSAPGDDLSSSYIGCLLLANGRGDHLYDFHPELFHVVDSAPWVDTAAIAHFTGFLHPYVQTPLWAWGLKPLCTHLSFSAFSAIFLCIGLLSLAVMIETVARAWAPRFLHPLPLVILLAAVAISTPFQYAMWLVQTHALFLMLTVLALHIAERDRPALAGALLAVACAVKITPGLLLLYWAIGGRLRAALWFLLWSVVLAALTVASVGIDLSLDYVQSMRRVSNVLLLSFNNQSLAAWLGYSRSVAGELFNWRMLPLSAELKGLSLVALMTSIAIAGWVSRKSSTSGAATALAIMGITIFSPIAWSHYYLALIPAVMVLVNAGGVWGLVVAATVFVLNSVPIAIYPIGPRVGPLTMTRSHFISAVILMAVLLARCIDFKALKSLQASPR